jgi:separase
MDRQEWRLAEGLLETLFSLVDLYFTRGSPREACCFAQQAQDLAEALNAPAMTGRALVKKGEIDLSRGRLDEGYANLMLAAKYIQDLPGTDTADIHRLRAEYNRRIDRPEDAQKLYERAMAVVDELDKVFSTFDVHAVRYGCSSDDWYWAVD